MTRPLSFQKLLVAVDEAGLANPAVAAAVHVAEATGAALELVQACPVPHALWIHESKAELKELLVARQIERFREQLRGVESELELDADCLASRATVVPGSASRVIAKYAAETGADILFLGAHAKHGAFDFGGTLRSALHHAPCALWVQPVEWKPLERILAPVDLSTSSLLGLAAARDLAGAAEAELVALYAHPSDDLFDAEEMHAAGWPTYVPDDLRRKAHEHFDSVMAEFDWRGVPHDDVFTEGDAAQRILDASEGTDLIVMATHGHSGVAGLFLGDVTYSVMKAGGVGLLALRAED